MRGVNLVLVWKHQSLILFGDDSAEVSAHLVDNNEGLELSIETLSPDAVGSLERV